MGKAIWSSRVLLVTSVFLFGCAKDPRVEATESKMDEVHEAYRRRLEKEPPPYTVPKTAG